MTTDDAPRPALDAGTLEELVYEFGRAEWRLGWNARSVNYSPADQADRDAKCAALVQAIREPVPQKGGRDARRTGAADAEDSAEPMRDNADLARGGGRGVAGAAGNDDVTGTTSAAGRQLLERSHLSVGGRAALANWLIQHADALLAAAAERDALAREAVRLRRAVVLALDGPSDGEIGMETTLGRLNRTERQLRAALSRQEGDGNGR